MNNTCTNLSLHGSPIYRQRAGVLLLVVLSMLTLFLMLGAAYLIMASRARDIARAYARLTLESDQSRVNYAQCLDNVLMTVIRGGATPVFSGTGTTISFESLLADRYGASLTISGSATVTSVSDPLVYATCSLASQVHPALLNGRVFTFVPAAGTVTSHRVLRASGSGPSYTVVLGPAFGKDSFSAPPADTRCLINGREFSGDGSDNEEHDGFDHLKNPYLAYLSPSVVPSESVCNKMSYVNGVFTGDDNGIPFAADNDGDGQPDGVFADFGIPPVVLSNGDSIRLDASVLIVDLDSRFNVNAHGSLAPATYLTSGTAFHSGWPSSSGTILKTGTNPITSPFIPFGTGYGPAEVSAEKIRFSHTYNRPTDEAPLAFAMLGGGPLSQIGQRTYGSRFYTSALGANLGAATPRLPAIQGRYGDPYSSALPAGTEAGRTWGLFGTTFQSPGWARPGINGQNDSVSRFTDELSSDPSVNQGIPATWWTGASAMPNNSATFNSPPDLQGRMKTVTNPIVSGSALAPTLWHAKPEWGNDTVDDPYESALADRTLRNASYVAASAVQDNPFSYSELERILRPYDIDSRSLAPRLAASLGSAAEEARLLLTTDSWDTTAVTGVTARKIQAWLEPGNEAAVTSDGEKLYATGTGLNAAVTGILSGELARGEKLDLSRPLTGTRPTAYSATDPYYVQRQALFKDLYTAMVMVSGSATTPTNHRELAQWAANVVEFRDADSTMTPLEYDINPRNGWDVDGNAASGSGDSDRGVVFGAERPEIIITEAFAWENAGQNRAGMIITLHRPWDAKALGSGTSSAPGEPCDAVFTSQNGNVVDLGKKITGQQLPIWRLRVVGTGGASCVRFDPDGAIPDGSPFASEYRATISGSSPRLATNSTVCVSGTAAWLKNSDWQQVPISGAATVAQVSGAADFRAPSPVNSSATIYLERLSDPAAELTQQQANAIWNANHLASDSTLASGTSTVTVSVPMYRIVDALTVNVENTTNPKKCRRRTTASETLVANSSFWRSATIDESISTMGANTANSNAAWYHWPNRPLISPIELLLVPSGDAAVMLKNYAQPTATTNALYAFDSSMSLLDAVTVPTRFAGVHLTPSAWSNAMERATGMYSIVKPVNQISTYREPARINMNTVVGYYDYGLDSTGNTINSEVWNALVAGPLPYPTTPYDQSTFVFKPRRVGTTKAVPADPKLGIPATPAVPGSGNNKKQSTTINNPAIPGQSLSAAIISSAGEEKFLDLIAGSSPPAYTSSFMGSTERARLNPYHKLSTAIRLGNTATVRSNVFGIWITLREFVAGDPDSVKLHRAFYIVDRSIPVGFENGKDHNVRDMIQLRRIIE